MERDQYFMQAAIELAKRAGKYQEVPVGAVLVREGEIIGQGLNTPIMHCDPTAHAEIVALQNGAKHIENYRLNKTTLYVTLEPCSMCVGALIHARVQRLVFGAYDPKSGAVCSAITLLNASHFNHHVEWTGGILENECSTILKDFFKARRK